LVLRDASGLEIDLHWSVGLADLASAGLIEQSQRLTLFGSSVWVVGPGDAVALTVRHSIRENLAIDTMCRDLLDLRAMWQLLARRGDLESVLSCACDAGGVVPLLALAQVLLGLNRSEVGVARAFIWLEGKAAAKQRRTAERLHALFCYQVRRGAIEKDVVYLSHSKPVRQMVSGAWANWREYRRLMLSMEEKLDGQTIPLGRRLWKLVLAVKDTRPAHLLGLRALARLRFEGTQR
jgi:hypothetical protein